MANITLRQSSGNTEPRLSSVTVANTPLTVVQLDNNFNNLNNDIDSRLSKSGGSITGNLTVSGDTALSKAISAEMYSDSFKLDGSNYEALHRSPNAITAMFLYDTSKDSDGGAWTEKCQHTSWYNEPLSGKWLGAQTSETNARNVNATLGSELVSNGTFDTNTTGWSAIGTATLSLASGQLNLNTGTNPNYGAGFSQTLPITIGKPYLVSVSFSSPDGGASRVRIVLAGAQIYSDIAATTQQTFWSVFVPTAGNTLQIFADSITSNANFKFDNISVREVTAQTTATGDYFQLTTDGKFYKLWKNLLSNTETLAAAGGWTVSNASSVIGATDPNAGTSAYTLTATASNGFIHRQSNKAVAGVKFTNSIYVRRVNGSGAVTLYTDLGAEVSITPTASWSRYSATWSATGTNGYIGIKLATSGDVVEIWHPQQEYGSTATTYEVKAADGATTEVFRGNKKSFPKVAAIVAEASNVTIYDLTEPGRPMWMRFTVGSMLPYRIWDGTSSGGCVAMLNGIMSGSPGGAWGGATVVDFPRDSAKRYREGGAGNGSTGYFMSGISNRNFSLGYYGTLPNIATTPGQGAVINAVAMTVLPDAPVDPVTGLKVPTIDLFTAGGISRIQHNGVVVSATNVGGLHKGGQTGRKRQIQTSFDRVAVSDSLTTNLGDPLFRNAGYGAMAGRVHYLATQSAATGFAITGNKFAVAQPFPLNIININENSGARSVAAHITNTFNTGHLIGDIRRCFLSDITTGSVTGPELVTNGTFDTDTSWTKDAATTIVGGTANFDGVTSLSPSVGLLTSASPVATQLGKTYAISYTIINGTTTPISVGFGSSNPGVARTAAGTYTDYLVAPSNNAPAFVLTRSGVGIRTGSVDNISVKEVIPDRSYKAAGANIYGTLTASAVNSGNSLVAYSGFSGSNYLQEPYSADLDFGTSEWSVGAWLNTTQPAVGGNLLTWSEPKTLPANMAVLNVPTFDAGANFYFAVGGISLVDSTVNRRLRIEYSPVVGQTYTLSFYVIVGAGVLPNQGAGNYRDFTLSINGNDVTNYTTITNTVFRDGIYRCTYTFVANSYIYLDFWKYAGLNNNTQCVFFGFQLELGSSATTYKPTTDTAILPVGALAHRAFSSGPAVKLEMTHEGKLQAVAYDGTTTRTVTTTAAYNTATWNKVRATYTTDGTLSLTVNGVNVASTTGTPLLTLNNSSAVLTIGNSYALDAPFPGSISLLKLSATVPTAEQSTWMYEQEKHLFTAGAQCVLPSSGNVLDLAYDDETDTWIATQAGYESTWSGLVRTSNTSVPAGSFSKTTATSGIKLSSTTTTNPGVYISSANTNFYSYNKISKDKNVIVFDYDTIGFSANTINGNTSLTSVTVTAGTPYIGMKITGTGIPTDTTITGIYGTTYRISNSASASNSGVAMGQADFILPVGYTAVSVYHSGNLKREGSTKDYVKLYDGFKETIIFGTSPGANAWVQIYATQE